MMHRSRMPRAMEHVSFLFDRLSFQRMQTNDALGISRIMYKQIASIGCANYRRITRKLKFSCKLNAPCISAS